MKVKFLTAKNRKSLPDIYTTESLPLEDKVAQVRFFNPYGNGVWLAFEFDGKDTFFGAVKLHGDWELGYFSLKELEAIRTVFYGKTYSSSCSCQGIERDRYFTPTRFGDILD